MELLQLDEKIPVEVQGDDFNVRYNSFRKGFAAKGGKSFFAVPEPVSEEKSLMFR